MTPWIPYHEFLPSTTIRLVATIISIERRSVASSHSHMSIVGDANATGTITAAAVFVCVVSARAAAASRPELARKVGWTTGK